MSSKKVWIVSLSIAAHVAVFTTAFVTNAWRVERLDPERRSFSLAVLPPPPAPSGGPKAGEKPKDPVPPTKHVATEPTQPVEQKVAPPKAVAADDGGGGHGDKKGPGDNPDGDPLDTGSCTGPACGPPSAPPAEKPPVVEVPPIIIEKPPIVPPSTLRRLSGETAIAPSDVIKTQMLREGHRRVVGSFKICLSEAGRVTSIGAVGSTKYPEYDQRLMTAMRGWVYAPYLIQGRPAPVCSAVSFVYTME